MNTRLLFGLLAGAVFVPIASANSYNFTACPASNPGCTANAALPPTVTYSAPGFAIQLDLTNLAKAGVTSGTLTIGSVQVGDSFQICNSAALGTIGTCGSPVAGN